MSAALLDEAAAFGDTGREIDPKALLQQIGWGNLAAISGGRWGQEGPSTVRLPAGSGFFVLVTLEADDTYTVRRVFKRGLKLFAHGELRSVYCDDIGNVAYYASCHVSYDADAWLVKARGL